MSVFSQPSCTRDKRRKHADTTSTLVTLSVAT